MMPVEVYTTTRLTTLRDLTNSKPAFIGYVVMWCVPERVARC